MHPIQVKQLDYDLTRTLADVDAVLPLTVVSDGLHCFLFAASVGAMHDREITGGGKAGVLNERFVADNTIIGNVTNALTGTYRAIKFAKHAYR